MSASGQPPFLVQRLHSDRQAACVEFAVGLSRVLVAECPLPNGISGRPPALISSGDWHWCCVSSALSADYRPARQNSYLLEFAVQLAPYSVGATLRQSGSQVVVYRRRRRRHSAVAHSADLPWRMPQSLVRDIVGRSAPYSNTCQDNRDIIRARSRRLSAGRCLRSRLGRSFRGLRLVAFVGCVLFCSCFLMGDYFNQQSNFLVRE